jgi:hypothetical protein
MVESPLHILRELAKRFKGRMPSTNFWDANVCTWTHPPGRTWEFTLVSGEPFSKELRYAYRDHNVRMFANHFFLNTEVAASFTIEHLSINRKNENNVMLKAAGPFRINGKQYSTFTESGALTSKHRKLFARAEFKTAVHELDLQAQESLHFAVDSISAYFDHPPLSRVIKVIESFRNLAESMAEPVEDLDLTVLPVQFHPLIPLIKKWAISDDSDREDFLTSSPKTILKSLVSEIEPYLPAIDSYLDSFGHRAPSEEAAALGRLAECASEAKQHLSDK